MNIGYLVKLKWYPPSGGASGHAYQVANQLIQRGHHLHTIFYYDPIPNVTVYRERQLLNFLRKIDVLYIRVDGRYGHERFTSLKILKLMKLPVVWEINSPVEELLASGKSEKEVRRMNAQRVFWARYVDACTCVSQELMGYAQGVLKIKRAHLVPNGSDRELFSPDKNNPTIYPDLKNRFKVVWAGSSHYTWQATDVIMEVARKMSTIDKDVTFILITKEQDLKLSGDLPKNIRILEEKKYLDIPPHIASADAGLCLYHHRPSWNGEFYGSSLKLFDYMSSGLPVIATDIGQIKDVIETEKNGLLVNNDISSIIESILYLKNNPQEAKRMGREGRRAVDEYYNWDRVGNETERILNDVLPRRTSG